MGDVLASPLSELFADRTLLGRVVRAIMLDAGDATSYVDALERVHVGADAAHDQAHGASARLLDQDGREQWLTLGRALELACVDRDYVGEAIGLLKRRDRVVKRSFKRGAGKLSELDVDSRGVVTTTQSKKKSTDVGAALHDPVTRERRFETARKLDQRYAGPEGRALFDQDDTESVTPRTGHRTHFEERLEASAQTGEGAGEGRARGADARLIDRSRRRQAARTQTPR